MVRTPSGFTISDWITGQLWRLDQQANVSSELQSVPGLADIGAGEGLLLMPLMPDGMLEVRTLK